MRNENKKYLFYLLGLATGVLNGLFGSGGGMIAVPMLKGLGVEAESSHATSISIIFPLAIASGMLYLKAGSFKLGDALAYMPGGVAGAVFGAWMLPKIGTARLRRIFAIVILFAAGRLILR